MQLNAREAAELLNVSDKTVYRWIKEGRLPAYKVNDCLRFNKAELLEWATSQRINVSVNIFENEADISSPMPGLSDALRCGGIYYRVGGSDVASVLESIIDISPIPESVDRNFLLQVLLARESLGSTGIGRGISIPHPRNPIITHSERPMVSLCFLEKPVDFNSLDGLPVHTVFMLVSPLIRMHLSLISRISFSLQQKWFMDLIVNQASREDILRAVGQIDQELATEKSEEKVQQ